MTLPSRSVINVRNSEVTHSVMATMDGVPIETFPVHLPWVRIEKLPGEQVSVLLMAIQVKTVLRISISRFS